MLNTIATLFSSSLIVTLIGIYLGHILPYRHEWAKIYSLKVEEYFKLQIELRIFIEKMRRIGFDINEYNKSKFYHIDTMEFNQITYKLQAINHYFSNNNKISEILSELNTIMEKLDKLIMDKGAKELSHSMQEHCKLILENNPDEARETEEALGFNKPNNTSPSNNPTNQVDKHPENTNQKTLKEHFDGIEKLIKDNQQEIFEQLFKVYNETLLKIIFNKIYELICALGKKICDFCCCKEKANQPKQPPHAQPTQSPLPLPTQPPES